MATRTVKRSGKKFRKVGRGARKPSQVRYNQEQRWASNKARRVARNTRRSDSVERTSAPTR